MLKNIHWGSENLHPEGQIITKCFVSGLVIDISGLWNSTK
jgi:hypothetical protein